MKPKYARLFFALALFCQFTSANADLFLQQLLAGVEDRHRSAVLMFQSPDKQVNAVVGKYREGGPAASISDPFLLASITKLYVAVALLKLDETGKLNVDDPASKWLPADVVRGFDGLKGITIAHLLQMRSGIPDYLDGDYIERIFDEGPLANPVREGLKQVYDSDLLFAPGTRFNYSNSNYLLAQLILEGAAGLAFDKALAQLVFNPAKLHRTRLLGYNSGPDDMVAGRENGMLETSAQYQLYYSGSTGMGDGGLVAPARDVISFYYALFVDGTLLTEVSLQRLIADTDSDNYGLGIEVEMIEGLGLVLGHSGRDPGYLNNVRFALDHDAIAVQLAGDGDFVGDLAMKMLEHYIQQ